MRAAVRTRFGSPEVVSVVDVPTPVLGDGEMLVEVHATTVNRTDCHYRSATPFPMRVMAGPIRPRATVLGTEYAGVVEALGEGVTTWAVGDRVFGYVEGRFGAHAEHLVVRADGPHAAIPDGVRFGEAAPATEGTHYALSQLRTGGVHGGERVLVYGATGAIGSAAVQLLATMGCTVTAVCPTRHTDVVASLGADRVVDYETADFTAGTDRYDVLLDAWGHLSYRRVRHLVTRGGTYLSTGPGVAWENLALPLLGGLLHPRVRFSYPRIDAAMVQGFADQLAAGTLRPLVDRTYPLESIVDAYRYVEGGQKLGNVVLEVVPT